jgi:hypothetical protein
MRIPRFTYSNVAATLALFLALGGTSYAALTITGSNVRNGTLTGSDIKDSSLQSKDVKNSSLLAKDFKSGELPAGPQGDPGPQGPQGEPGAPGAPGATNVVARRTNVVIADGAQDDATASCQAGEVAVGGGASITDSSVPNTTAVVWDTPLEADESLPEAGETATQWQALGVNASGSAQIMAVVALCASP